MNMFDIEAGRPIVARYVISELLDDHLDHIISVHSAVYWGRAVRSLTHGRFINILSLQSTRHVFLHQSNQSVN